MHACNAYIHTYRFPSVKLYCLQLGYVVMRNNLPGVMMVVGVIQEH